MSEFQHLNGMLLVSILATVEQLFICVSFYCRTLLLRRGLLDVASWRMFACVDFLKRNNLVIDAIFLVSSCGEENVGWFSVLNKYLGTFQLFLISYIAV